MKKIALFSTIAAALAFGAIAPSNAFAATSKAKHPAKHMTPVKTTSAKAAPAGDAATDKLNQQQLDQAKTAK